MKKNKIYNNLKNYAKQGDAKLDRFNLSIMVCACMACFTFGVIFPPMGFNFAVLTAGILGLTSAVDTFKVFYPKSKNHTPLFSKALSFLELAIFDTICLPAKLLKNENANEVVEIKEENAQEEQVEEGISFDMEHENIATIDNQGTNNKQENSGYVQTKNEKVKVNDDKTQTM